MEYADLTRLRSIAFGSLYMDGYLALIAKCGEVSLDVRDAEAVGGFGMAPRTCFRSRASVSGESRRYECPFYRCFIERDCTRLQLIKLYFFSMN